MCPRHRHRPLGHRHTGLSVTRSLRPPFATATGLSVTRSLRPPFRHHHRSLGHAITASPFRHRHRHTGLSVTRSLRPPFATATGLSVTRSLRPPFRHHHRSLGHAITASPLSPPSSPSLFICRRDVIMLAYTQLISFYYMFSGLTYGGR